MQDLITLLRPTAEDLPFAQAPMQTLLSEPLTSVSLAQPERVIVCVRHTAFMSVCMLGGWNRSVVVHASEDETKAWQRAFGNAEVRCMELYVAGGGQR